MATSITTSENDSGPASRRHRGLVALFLKSGKDAISMDNIDTGHPLVMGSTISEIKKAIEDANKLLSDELCEQYKVWMRDDEEFSITKGTKTEWIPLRQMRFSNLKKVDTMTSRAMLVWSPVDVWLVHYFEVLELNTRAGARATTRKAYYSTMSPVSREPAEYFIVQKNSSGSFEVAKAVGSPHPRIQEFRPFMAAFSADAVSILETRNKEPVNQTSHAWQLHKFIISKILP